MFDDLTLPNTDIQMAELDALTSPSSKSKAQVADALKDKAYFKSLHSEQDAKMNSLIATVERGMQ